MVDWCWPPCDRGASALAASPATIEHGRVSIPTKGTEPRDATPSPGAPDIHRDATGSAGQGTDAHAPIRVLVAEDSYLIREVLMTTLNAAPEVDVVAVCSNEEELRTAFSRWHPDVVLTDIRMPPTVGDEGIRVATMLRETDPEVGVVILSQYAEPAYALALLERGTGRRAYLLKERIRTRRELVEAIEAVARGGSVIDPVIVDVLIKARSKAARSRVAQLTGREREILAEIAAGKSNAAIADSLVLTKRAVEKHVNAIFAKLDLPEMQDVSRRVKATLIFLAEEDDAL
jgi:DNA-binding NarL/FixJ family response regulator